MLETVGTCPPDVRSTSAPASGELAFRIRGGDYHGRVVRIRAAQCTIGSAADCTLRLSAPGVRPLHCIILRGDAGATVRRWSPDTQLNSRAFSDALLMLGDRLQIGPIELEVIDDADLPRANRPTPTNDTLAPSATPPAAELAGEIVQHLRRDLERNEHQKRDKLRRKRLRAAREKVKSLEADLRRTTQATKRLEEEVERLRQLPEQSPDAVDWSAERNLLTESLEKLQSELADRDDALATARADFAQQRDAWQQRQIELEQAVQAQPLVAPVVDDDAIAALRAELVSQQALWQQERKALQHSLEEKAHLEHRLEVALSGLRKAVDQEHLEAANERQQMEEERKTLALRSAECDEQQKWCDQVELKSRHMAEYDAGIKAEMDSLYARIEELEREAVTKSSVERSLARANPQIEEQLATVSNELDDARSRCTELHAQLAAQQNVEPEQAQPEYTQLRGLILELEQQLLAKLQELSTTQAELEQCRADIKRHDEDFTLREQTFAKRIECLERLARSLEDELRGANAEGADREQDQAEQTARDQHWASSQQQWNQQRQILEEQAVSAHSQLQELEDQVASLRDALRATKGQVRERDDLLTQLRDEVRQQYGVWQQERETLLEHREDGANRSPPAGAETNDESADACSPVDEVSEHNALSREDNAGDSSVGVNDVLARLGAAGIWKDETPSEAEHTPWRDEPSEESRDESSDEPSQQTSDEPSIDTLTSEVPSWRSSLPIESVEELGAESADAEAPAPVGHSLFGTPSPSASGPGDEESIEAYMSRLLKRVRGDAVANAFTAQQAPAEIAEDPAVQTALAVESADQPLTEGEYLPRKSAPELQSNMAAMRELAVHSARQAITHSSQRRHRQAALAVTLGAFTAYSGAVGLFAWGWDTGNKLAWASCLACLVAAGYFTWRRIHMRLRLRAAKR